jgi:hypothetical protein
MSDRATRLAGLAAVVAAAAAVLVSPLLALSYFATDEGAAELEKGTVSAWADPARDFAGGLLTWASPERVYGTYWLLFWALFAAVFLCARAAHGRRPAGGRRLERWGWRAALVGYGLGAVGAIAACVIVVSGSTADSAIDVAFVALMLPATAIDVIGSTVLGIALLRSRFEPRVTAWLLTFVFPSMLVFPVVLGNLSLGLLTVFVAWAVTGWRLWRAEDLPTTPERSATARGQALPERGNVLETTR